MLENANRLRALKLSFVMATVLGSNMALALAGGSTGGGGMLLKDSMNPWFVQNTSVIHYCIASDPSQFKLNVDAADRLIQRAYAFWQHEFTQTPLLFEVVLSHEDHRILVGTQQLTRVDCKNNPELRFQLGTLSPEQVPFVDDLESTIAQTARTAYDRVHLRAAGFIYVAPDNGPGPVAKTPLPAGQTRWTVADGQLFYLMIAHELGHIFGLPDSGLSTSLMSYSWAQQVMASGGEANALTSLNELATSGVFAPERVNYGNTYFFVGPFDTLDNGAGRQQMAQALGLDFPTGDWVVVNASLEGQQLRLAARTRTEQDPSDLSEGLAPIGHADLTLRTVKLKDTLIGMWLPPEQKVFTLYEPSYGLITLVFAYATQAIGSYQPVAGGPATPITFTIRPGDDQLQISAVVAGQLIGDFLNTAYPVGPFGAR